MKKERKSIVYSGSITTPKRHGRRKQLEKDFKDDRNVTGTSIVVVTGSVTSVNVVVVVYHSQLFCDILFPE